LCFLADKFIILWNPWSGAQISYIKGQYTHALPLPLLSSLVATADATFSVFENKKGTLRHAKTVKALSAPIIFAEYLTRRTISDPNVVTICSDGLVSMWDTRSWESANSFHWRQSVSGCCVAADELSVCMIFTYLIWILFLKMMPMKKSLLILYSKLLSSHSAGPPG
jgi:hypothetical protein